PAGACANAPFVRTRAERKRGRESKWNANRTFISSPHRLERLHSPGSLLALAPFVNRPVKIYLAGLLTGTGPRAASPHDPLLSRCAVHPCNSLSTNGFAWASASILPPMGELSRRRGRSDAVAFSGAGAAWPPRRRQGRGG